VTLEVVFFDVDGTLADTERDGHRVAFNRAFQEAGLDWDWSVELYGQLLRVTGGKERIRYYLDQFNPDFVRPAGLDAFIAGLHQAKTAHYTRMLGEGAIPLRPGVERLIHEARDCGLRLAITTTTTPLNVTALLESTLGPQSLDWFEVIAAGDIVPAKKPAPDIYLWALEKMGVAPGNCLAIEDSDNGVRSVLDAGIPSLVVTVNDYTRDQNFAGATLVLDHLGEPDSPCRALSGAGPAKGYLDVAGLRALHERASG
jgi:beta-phosphoglucomutase-like phosphatase (HAD superfamily)